MVTSTPAFTGRKTEHAPPVEVLSDRARQLKLVLRAGARELKLVLTDADGVLTDTGVYYSGQGEEFKRFSIRDGMGVERLRNQGIETAILTREKTPSIKRRAEQLKLRYLDVGVKDKLAHLSIILAQTGFGASQVGYIGDDINDQEVI